MVRSPSWMSVRLPSRVSRRSCLIWVMSRCGTLLSPRRMNSLASCGLTGCVTGAAVFCELSGRVLFGAAGFTVFFWSSAAGFTVFFWSSEVGAACLFCGGLFCSCFGAVTSFGGSFFTGGLFCAAGFTGFFCSSRAGAACLLCGGLVCSCFGAVTSFGGSFFSGGLFCAAGFTGFFCSSRAGAACLLCGGLVCSCFGAVTSFGGSFFSGGLFCAAGFTGFFCSSGAGAACLLCGGLLRSCFCCCAGWFLGGLCCSGLLFSFSFCCAITKARSLVAALAGSMAESANRAVVPRRRACSVFIVVRSAAWRGWEHPCCQCRPPAKVPRFLPGTEPGSRRAPPGTQNANGLRSSCQPAADAHPDLRHDHSGNRSTVAPHFVRERPRARGKKCGACRIVLLELRPARSLHQRPMVEGPDANGSVVEQDDVCRGSVVSSVACGKPKLRARGTRIAF